MISFAGRQLIKMSEKADAQRDAGLTIPESIRYVRNLAYGEDKQYQNLDLCYPLAMEEKNEGSEKTADNNRNSEKNTSDADISDRLPVIVSVHGGGYVYGDSNVYQFYCADLARRGFIVVNFNYRLAPKYKFPAPLEDLDSVLFWITAHKDEYPFDTDNVFIVGDSAGAQIASQYAVIYTNESYRKLFGFKLPDLKLRGLGLNCGMYDLEENVKKYGRFGIWRDYFGWNGKKLGEKLKVLSYITADYPPSHLISSGGDSMKPFIEPMAELLKKKGVKCEYCIYGDENTYHVFHVNVRLDTGIMANDDQTAFFKELIEPCQM